ncbi:potassium transporter [Cylindrobasidium torrendii FP15055 ss-10]|uniref:Potassium transporter n=1 Tax=Cylindrobasidium torrendii FP15055 ss-10 TaxID=1314674 RepID=A0A0D7BNU5_9AGAR|nr:potassium transporter [Cylindrobasidium torrendii FP15055 ss-10]
MSTSPKVLESGFVFNPDARRTAVGVHGLQLAKLSFQTLGIIYSDIGTSPLYAMNGIFPTSGPVPSKEDVIGAISAIIWTLTLLAAIKYGIISLSCTTQEGEGGLFALFQGLYAGDHIDAESGRTLTGDYGKELRRFDTPKKPPFKQRMRWPLLVWCLFGTSLMVGDSVFLPAVSVTQAASGIAIAQPSVEDNLTPIAIAFLIIIFLLQHFGTARLALTFGPIAAVWFGLLLVTGAINISQYPAIFRALDPSRAVMLFVRTKNYDILAGVLLAVTGCEALFANVGQFNTLSIRISFLGLVYPTIMITYLGQGACLIVDGESVIQNIFYRSIPGPINGGLYWVMFVFAFLAILIASQAMITATFSLLQQLVAMRCFPPLRMTYTSKTMQGQVYIPTINWLLMIGAIIVVAAFTDLRAITNAYGFAVATVMVSTTLLISIHLRYIKKYSAFVALAYLAFFGFLDVLFWGASLRKIPHGAWVPLMIGIVLSLIMILWTWGKALENKFDKDNRQNLNDFIFIDNSLSDDSDDESDYYDYEYSGGPKLSYLAKPITRAENLTSSRDSRREPEIIPDKRILPRMRNCAIFYKLAEGKGVPQSFISLIRRWPALPEVLIFLSIRIMPIARVPPEARYFVTKTRSIPGCYGATYCIGYRDTFEVEVDLLIDQICELECMHRRMGRLQAEKIRKAAKTTSHIVPHYNLSSRPNEESRMRLITNPIRKFCIENLYGRLVTMFPERANWQGSENETMYIGINAPI